MMINSQGTQAQRWSKGMSVTLLCSLLVIHAAGIVLLLFYCPSLFQANKFQGGHCQTIQETSILGCEGCENSNCVSKSEGEHVSLANLMMSFKFPHDQSISVWNWQLTGSLSLYIKVFGDDLITNKAGSRQELVNLDSFQQPVTMSASLDYALNKNLGDKSDSLAYTSAWHSKARVRHVNRTLQCRQVPIPNEQIAADSESELSFVCVLTPFLELFPLSNSTYITSIQIEKLASRMPVNLVDTQATLITYLSVVTESVLFHEIRFYTKCIFIPLILVSLIWFMVRLCTNDLYVNIPDRLVITAAIAQLITNLPLEMIINFFPVPHLLLLGPVSEILSFSSLTLFWIIFTLDKLADNEPWERTTRYYWRCIGLVLTATALGLLTVFYLNFPVLNNPFMNHWQPYTTTYVSLGLIFSLAVVIAGFQSYLSILIFRVICDISVQ